MIINRDIAQVTGFGKSNDVFIMKDVKNSVDISCAAFSFIAAIPWS